jgi:type IV secretory pathway VirJ component
MARVLKLWAIFISFILLHLSVYSQSQLPLIELPTKAEHDFFAIFFSGDGGWRSLDQAVSNYLNNKNIPVVGVNIKKYLWYEKTPQRIALDIESMIQTYCTKWNVSNALLIGYSMGAEIIPHSANQLKDTFAEKIKDMILIAPAQNACFKIKLIFYAHDTNEGIPIIDELKKLKLNKAFCICDDQNISLCKSGLDGVIDHTLLTGGHHFDGDYNQLCKIIGKRLLLE